MKVHSPVTGNDQVSLVASFPTERIIEAYQKAGITVDRFFKDLPVVGLYECNETGYRFYHPDTIFGDAQFYMDLQQTGEGYYPKEKWEHRYCARLIGQQEKVLEVGAGDGFFLNLLKKKGIDARGLELNPRAVSEANEKGLKMDDETIQHHAAHHPGEYDVVCSFQVLEHIYDVREYLLACIAALKVGGKLILGVPNNNPYLYKHDEWHTLNLPPHHAGLWSRRAFTSLPAFFDLKEERIVIERLHGDLGQYGDWFHVQREYYRQHKPALYKMLSVVPRPFYKLMIRMFSPFIEGRNIIAVFTKV